MIYELMELCSLLLYEPLRTKSDIEQAKVL